MQKKKETIYKVSINVGLFFTLSCSQSSMFIDSTFDSYREKATQVDDVWNFQTFLNHDSYHDFIEKFYFTKKQKN